MRENFYPGYMLLVGKDFYPGYTSLWEKTSTQGACPCGGNHLPGVQTPEDQPLHEAGVSEVDVEDPQQHGHHGHHDGPYGHRTQLHVVAGGRGGLFVGCLLNVPATG